MAPALKTEVLAGTKKSKRKAPARKARSTKSFERIPYRRRIHRTLDRRLNENPD
jgi:hypothetical protein